MQARARPTLQLDWNPPDGGWTLRQVAHHLAQAEMYYTVWLDEALPDEAQARYLAARERFDQRLYQLCVTPLSEQTALFRRGDHSAATIEQVAGSVLASEQQLLAQGCYS